MTEMKAAQAVRDVVTRVAHRIDRREWQELRALYADDVHVDYTSLFGGEAQTVAGDALIENWRTLLMPLDATQHLIGPIEVEVRNDEADAGCHVRGYHVLGDDVWLVAAHWVMKLKRSPQWRIAHMQLDLLYQTGNRNLLTIAARRSKDTTI